MRAEPVYKLFLANPDRRRGLRYHAALKYRYRHDQHRRPVPTRENLRLPHRLRAGTAVPDSAPGQARRAGLVGHLPFFGVDIWNAYEISWLNQRGKPQVAIARITFPADTPNIIESKSFKLYLNSFNQTKLDSVVALKQLLQQDLSAAAGGSVHVTLTQPEEFGMVEMGELDGLLLDRLDIEVDNYSPSPDILKAALDEEPVEEKLVSHLLKSNCLVTGQPDWASVQIHYSGPQIDQESLLAT
jgi:7-cyano-7-deazaguanine reductase